ncbi:Hypothetical protein SRAE_X000215700 [Strongyloides ratti]|uniref:Uncharacterized protein n=1 Tax=Strongyloides ratti TaxID=34506 RepID=A0A090KYV3_STRRB|nr:Hypothetical protein SRAE_X000215700 [Strongyloides ratti]CEF60419.1 Hypothetical protein SRAE_X000215700 [Strongyloides ratti]
MKSRLFEKNRYTCILLEMKYIISLLVIIFFILNIAHSAPQFYGPPGYGFGGYRGYRGYGGYGGYGGYRPHWRHHMPPPPPPPMMGPPPVVQTTVVRTITTTVG